MIELDFLHKYCLFPRVFGFSPYFWLLWLLVPICQLWPWNSSFKYSQLFLIIVFIWFYRSSYTLSRWSPLWIGGQYLLAIYFYLNNIGLYFFVFTAWVIGSLPFNKFHFHWYLMIYYIALFIALAGKVVLTQFHWPASSSARAFSVIFMFFIILSPLGGRSIRNTYLRSGILKQQKQRYELLIRRQERDRIARDLHDSLGQAFTTITIQAELTQKILTQNPTEAKKQLTDIKKSAQQNLNLVRQIVTNMRTLSLPETLIKLTDKLQEFKISLITENENLSKTWPKKIQQTIAAVIQEAITNTLQYGQAQEVRISFFEEQAQARIIIVDDGQGFEKIHPGAHGIQGMQERVAKSSGTFQIHSSHHGTKIDFSLPLLEESAS